MLEICSRRRMVICIIALICLTILVILLESYLTSDTSVGQNSSVQIPPLSFVSPAPLGNTSVRPTQLRSQCWRLQSFSVIERCRPCSVFEKNSGSIAECKLGAGIEKLNCTLSGIVYRSCSVPAAPGSSVTQAGRLLRFEVYCLVTSLVSGVVVSLRQRHLHRIAVRQIRRQLASSVV